MKKIFAIVFLLTFMIVSVSLIAFAENDTASFNSLDKYAVVNVTPFPYTIEATVVLPQGFKGRGGIIIGNYVDYNQTFLNLEIQTNGNPRLCFVNAESQFLSNADIIFDKVDVRTGVPVHLAITINPALNNVIIYVDGKPAQTVKISGFYRFNFSNGFIIGGDYREDNVHYFKGKILNVSLYNDVRTSDEIFADATSDSFDKESLMAMWKLSSSDIIEDLSGNGHDIVVIKNSVWFDESDMTGDYGYSFAVIGDTQIVNCYYPDKFHHIYDWIIDNAEQKNIKFVFGLGDITDKNGGGEWTRAKKNIAKMNGVVPYSIVRGNHDGITEYVNTFPLGEFNGTVTGSYDGTMLNTYHSFEVGKIKYLVINLDYASGDDVLEWANKIILLHPYHNVIITTHIYLNKDGETVSANDSVSAIKYGAVNTPDDVWQKLIRKHKNIVLVLSGHVANSKIVVSQIKGDHGNTVTQLLVNPQKIDHVQGATGLVAMLYFSKDGKNVSVEYYSTVKDKFYCSGDPISFSVDVIEDKTEDTIVVFECVIKDLINKFLRLISKKDLI